MGSNAGELEEDMLDSSLEWFWCFCMGIPRREDLFGVALYGIYIGTKAVNLLLWNRWKEGSTPLVMQYYMLKRGVTNVQHHIYQTVPKYRSDLELG